MDMHDDASTVVRMVGASDFKSGSIEFKDEVLGTGQSSL